MCPMPILPTRRNQLDLAILDALTKRVNGSLATQDADNRHQFDCAGYWTDHRYKFVNPDEYDWEDSNTSSAHQRYCELRACGDDPALPLDRFTHFYDPITSKMFYIERESHPTLLLGVEPRPEGAAVNDSQSPGDVSALTPDRSELGITVARLTAMNSQFGPRGYISWLSNKLESRSDTGSNILGYSTLCDKCRLVLTHSLCIFSLVFGLKWSERGLYYETNHSRDIFSHHLTLAALRASANAGCHFCSLLFGPHDLVDSMRFEELNNTYLLGFEDQYVFISINSTPQQIIRVCTLHWQEPDASNATNTLRCSNTGAVGVYNIARSWLSRCLHEDKGLCSITTSFLPSRLIELSGRDDILNSARLILGQQLPLNTEYLTLSHCWGELRPLSLTRKTYDQFRNDIPLSVLSKTFRDTLQVVLRLGYQYVWIDSLCIQQDSIQEWRDEAAKMGDIYRHSLCTIAATGAKDGEDGLFFERNALTFAQCPLFERKGKHLYAETMREWPQPLSTRAWAVQERCLSSRLLTFGREKISWTCRRGQTCEGPHAHRVQMDSSSFSNLLDSNTDEDTVNHAWKSVVRTYSACKLTYVKDKWPAFQGLTAEVEKAQRWKLTHGLRTHMLGQDILWCLSTRGGSQGTIDCGEPSWSWLNIQGGIMWPWMIYGLDAQVNLQKQCAPDNTEDASPNSSNDIIRINACIIEFTTDLDYDYDWHARCEFTVKNPKFDCSYGLQSELESKGVFCRFWTPDTLPFQHQNLKAIQISSEWLWNSFMKRWMCQMQGLVISPVLQRPGYWRRVGYYEFNVTHRWPEEGSDSKESEHDFDFELGKTLSADEASLRGLPCPWNREKTTIYLI